LAPARVVGDGEHYERDSVRAFLRKQCLERGDIHIPLEIKTGLRVCGFGNGEIDSACAGELDIGACGIEVRVVWNDVARPARDGKENAFGRAALVRGHHVAEPGQVFDHAL
jgi:hypothetical protein